MNMSQYRSLSLSLKVWSFLIFSDGWELYSLGVTLWLSDCLQLPNWDKTVLSRVETGEPSHGSPNSNPARPAGWVAGQWGSSQHWQHQHHRHRHWPGCQQHWQQVWIRLTLLNTLTPDWSLQVGSYQLHRQWSWVSGNIATRELPRLQLCGNISGWEFVSILSWTQWQRIFSGGSSQWGRWNH